MAGMKGALHRTKVSVTIPEARLSEIDKLSQRAIIPTVPPPLKPLTTQAPKAGFPLTVHLPAGTGGNLRES